MRKLNLFIKELFTIIFSCAPIDGTLIVIEQIFMGADPVLEMLAISTFLDKAIELAKGIGNSNEIYLPITLLVSVVALDWITQKLIGVVNVQLAMKLKRKHRVRITEKVARLK